MQAAPPSAIGEVEDAGEIGGKVPAQLPGGFFKNRNRIDNYSINQSSRLIFAPQTQGRTWYLPTYANIVKNVVASFVSR